MFRQNLLVQLQSASDRRQREEKVRGCPVGSNRHWQRLLMLHIPSKGLNQLHEPTSGGFCNQHSLAVQRLRL